MLVLGGKRPHYTPPLTRHKILSTEVLDEVERRTSRLPLAFKISEAIGPRDWTSPRISGRCRLNNADARQWAERRYHGDIQSGSSHPSFHHQISYQPLVANNKNSAPFLNSSQGLCQRICRQRDHTTKNGQKYKGTSTEGFVPHRKFDTG